MCTDLTYRNSSSEYMVDIAYLAINKDVIINKTTNEYGYAGNYCYFDSEIMFQLYKDNEPTLTLLLTYKDEDDWEDALLTSLIEMNNNGVENELIDNILDMLADSMTINGFNNTIIGNLVAGAFDDFDSIHTKIVDFNMHFPTEDNIHPNYDT